MTDSSTGPDTGFNKSSWTWSCSLTQETVTFTQNKHVPTTEILLIISYILQLVYRPSHYQKW